MKQYGAKIKRTTQGKLGGWPLLAHVQVNAQHKAGSQLSGEQVHVCTCDVQSALLATRT